MSTKQIESLIELYGKYANETKSAYDVVSDNGKYLTSIGSAVDVWLLEEHCFFV